MRPHLHLAIGVSGLFLLFFSFISLGWTWNNVKNYKDVHIIHLSKEVPPSQIFHSSYVHEEKTLAITLFSEKKGQIISNSYFNRSVEVKAISIFGSSALLFPDSYPLEKEDLTGCLIDTHTAWELFGDMNIIGATIDYKNQTYEIRGLLDHPVPVFLYEAPLSSPSLKEEEENILFSQVVAKALHPANTKEVGQMLWNLYNLEGTESILNFGRIPDFSLSWNEHKAALWHLILKENNCVETVYLIYLSQQIYHYSLFLLGLFFFIIYRKELLKHTLLAL